MKARRRRRGQNPKPRRIKDVWRIWIWKDVADENGRVRRKQTSRTLGTVSEMTYSEACQRAREVVEPINRMDAGIEFQSRTMNQLITAWRESAKPHLKRSTQGSYEWAIKRIQPALGRVPVAEIDKAMVQKLLTEASRELSPISVRNLQAHLSGILSLAIDWGWIARNPARGRLRLPPKVRARRRVILTPNQIGHLVKELPQPYNVVVLLMVLTGLRAGEVAALRWDDIGQDTVTVDEAVYRGTLGTPKSLYSAEEVCIGPSVRQAIEEWRKGAEFTAERDFVFAVRTNSPIDLHNAMARHVRPGCRRLGLPPVSWHDLRHTYATWGRRAGIQPEAMRQLMRHADITTTLGIYSHIGEERALEAAKIEAFFTQETRATA